MFTLLSFNRTGQTVESFQTAISEALDKLGSIMSWHVTEQNSTVQLQLLTAPVAHSGVGRSAVFVFWTQVLSMEAFVDRAERDELHVIDALVFPIGDGRRSLGFAVVEKIGDAAGSKRTNKKSDAKSDATTEG